MEGLPQAGRPFPHRADPPAHHRIEVRALGSLTNLAIPPRPETNDRWAEPARFTLKEIRKLPAKKQFGFFVLRSIGDPADPDLRYDGPNAPTERGWRGCPSRSTRAGEGSSTAPLTSWTR